MATPRSNIVEKNKEATFHCYSRCVRKSFLLGDGPDAFGQYNHRKEWMRQRLIFLSKIFFVDIIGYAVMSNHFHLIIRIRPDLREPCDDREIARRWHQLFPGRRDALPNDTTFTETKINHILETKDMDELAQNLTSLSWFMACLKEPIARRANREDNCTGRFWEGRFKCVELLDQAAITTCMAYVDLNPIRAGIAETPESSDFTSGQDRIAAYRIEQHESAQTGLEKKIPMRTTSKPDHWLCPLTNERGRRGVLNIPFEQYLKILDETGRQVVNGKTGAIPEYLEPILTRININHNNWLRTCSKFKDLFCSVAGTLPNIKKAEERSSKKWLKGKAASKKAFLVS